jgi:uncharacterized protein involved in propanediol utilization
LFQGALARGGEVVPCLITMPSYGIGSTVRYTPAAAGLGPAPAAAPAPVARRENLQVLPSWKKKAECAARLALGVIGAPIAGRLEIECAVATGVGLGSSTCDVVAAIRAVCDAHGAQLGPAEVARLAIEAEGAADPLMFDGMLLFAQRHGRVLESFGAWVPEFTVLSIDTDEAGAGVDTLALPIPSYTEAELARFENMVGRAREAFRRRDRLGIAAVATESAMLNQRFLPMRQFAEIRAFAAAHDAFGVQISHSGTVAGVLFDPGRVPVMGSVAVQILAEARAMGVRPLGLFTTGGKSWIDRLTPSATRP